MKKFALVIIIPLLIVGIFSIVKIKNNKTNPKVINQDTIEQATNQIAKNNTEKLLTKDDKKKIANEVSSIIKIEESSKKIAEPYFRIDTQNIGEKVVITYVNYTKNSFMVIKKPGTYGEEEFMGVSKLLPAGKNENFDIALNSKVAGTALTAYLFEDDGDGFFNESSDSKAIDPRNNFILTQDFDVRIR